MNISPLDQQGEFYDYQTANGAAEIDNTFANNLHAAEMRRQLLNIYLPAELRAPMPLSLQPAQQASEQLMVAFLENLESSGE